MMTCDNCGALLDRLRVMRAIEAGYMAELIRATAEVQAQELMVSTPQGDVTKLAMLRMQRELDKAILARSDAAITLEEHCEGVEALTEELKQTSPRWAMMLEIMSVYDLLDLIDSVTDVPMMVIDMFAMRDSFDIASFMAATNTENSVPHGSRRSGFGTSPTIIAFPMHHLDDHAGGHRMHKASAQN